ncbi:MAG: sulfatase-like hydrolase/transferase [Desulfobacterales bacterium]|nr:sulfatase-like hydrolase/transferase [Desulfobacterales bacterium]
MNKKLVLVEATLITAVICLVDYCFRTDLILQTPRKHFLVIMAVFLFYYFLKLLLGLVPWKTLRVLLGLVVGGCIGMIYGVDYNYFASYGRFMGPHEFSMLIGEFGYWRDNIGNLLSKGEMLSLLFYIIPSLFVFSGALGWLLKTTFPRLFESHPKTLNTKTISFRVMRVARSSVLHILVMPIVFLIAFEVLAHNEAEFLFTPEYASYYGFSELKQNPEEYKIKPPRVEFPERNKDDSAVLVNQRKPNIVFILLESLNMHQTSMFGYKRDTTPHLEKYSRESLRYDGISNSTTTTFSTTSLFNGLDWSEININSTLSNPLLWWYTKFAGYENHVFTSQWLRYRSKGDYFIDRSCTTTLKEPLYSSRSLGRDDFITVAELDKTLPEIKKAQGQFIYINFAGTHFPYRVKDEYRLWEPTRDRGFHPRYLHLTVNQYNNAVLTMDAAFAEAIEVLEKHDVLDNSIVIVSSDHGEAMMEHGRWGHGPVYWQEGIQIPLYIKIGDNVKSLISETELAHLEENQSYFVSNVDIVPTVLDIIGVATERKFSGQSLLRHYPENIAFSSRGVKKYAALNSHTGFKLIVSNKLRQIQCMNIKSDPTESNVTTFSFAGIEMKPDQVKGYVRNMTECVLPYEKVASK